MKAFSFYLFTFIAFCLLQCAPALECYQCSDIPGLSPNSNTCRSGKLGKTTCKGIVTKCYTVKLQKSELSVVVRDCVIGDGCRSPEFRDYPCKVLKNKLNITRADSCDMKCCGEDLCDPWPADRTGAAAGFPSVFAASSATVILWAFFFNIFT